MASITRLVVQSTLLSVSGTLQNLSCKIQNASVPKARSSAYAESRPQQISAPNRFECRGSVRRDIITAAYRIACQLTLAHGGAI